MAEPGPLDNRGLAGSLADAIRRQAATQAQIASGGKPLSNMPLGNTIQQMPSIAPVDPLEQLTRQIQGINVAATPLETLRGQANSVVSPQFDQMIRALQSQMDQTKGRAATNQGTVKQMYGDLATDIAAEIPNITANMAASEAETQNRYDQTQAELQGQYKNQQAQQAQLLQSLGIQAAAPDASQQSMEDQAYFQNQSRLDEANSLQALERMKNSDIAYQQQSADNTKLAGTNAAADIGAQLEQYLQGANSEMNNLTMSKEAAIASMLTQLQQSDSERVARQEQQEYGRLMDMYNLQLQQQAMQMERDKMLMDQQGSQNNSLFKGTNSMSGSANYLDEIYGQDSFTKNSIMSAINDVMSDPTVISGKYQSPDMKDAMGNPVMLDVTNEKMIDLLRNRLQGGSGNNPLTGASYSDADMNNAINALMARLGQLK